MSASFSSQPQHVMAKRSTRVVVAAFAGDTTGQAWKLRACDPTRRTSLSPRHDRKREVDSKAEVSGT
jgi:hypothetical protein